MNLQQKVTKLSTSPNECHYTTLWNTTCVELFITTVMQALDVMTNWQLQTNTSQQMLKIFAFGFDPRIKTISPLINCLINDAVLDSWPCQNHFFRHFRWMSLCMIHPTDLREMSVSLSIWWIVLSLSLVHPTDSVPNHWLHQCSQQYVMCEVCHCPAVNLLCRFLAVFNRILQTA